MRFLLKTKQAKILCFYLGKTSQKPIIFSEFFSWINSTFSWGRKVPQKWKVELKDFLLPKMYGRALWVFFGAWKRFLGVDLHRSGQDILRIGSQLSSLTYKLLLRSLLRKTTHDIVSRMGGPSIIVAYFLAFIEDLRSKWNPSTRGLHTVTSCFNKHSLTLYTCCNSHRSEMVLSSRSLFGK